MKPNAKEVAVNKVLLAVEKLLNGACEEQDKITISRIKTKSKLDVKPYSPALLEQLSALNAVYQAHGESVSQLRNTLMTLENFRTMLVDLVD
jgi:uncharacterized protein (DUF342 family)